MFVRKDAGFVIWGAAFIDRDAAFVIWGATFVGKDAQSRNLGCRSS